ncbi:46038_t:CDS:2 [Gigaspora margarita]|uniref:46038_t:CDS:1 n=1 Tax=Gigaspora margarita TaxID=4874 RepID=A0ABN7V942_GIGMA|nr:46038_t:CDS:2 [Gigaspora margarita]
MSDIRVVIKYSTVMLGNILEWDVISELKSIGFRRKIESSSWPTILIVERSSLSVIDVPEDNIGPLCVREALSILESVQLGSDRGRDIICQIAGVTFAIQCKNYNRRGSIDNTIIFAYETVTRRYASQNEGVTIGIVVAPSILEHWPPRGVTWITN